MLARLSRSLQRSMAYGKEIMTGDCRIPAPARGVPPVDHAAPPSTPITRERNNRASYDGDGRLMRGFLLATLWCLLACGPDERDARAIAGARKSPAGRPPGAHLRGEPRRPDLLPRARHPQLDDLWRRGPDEHARGFGDKVGCGAASTALCSTRRSPPDHAGVGLPHPGCRHALLRAQRSRNGLRCG